MLITNESIHWYYTIKRHSHTKLTNQNIRTTTRTWRTNKINRCAWNDAKNKSNFGTQSNNGVMGQFYHYIIRELNASVPKLDIYKHK